MKRIFAFLFLIPFLVVGASTAKGQGYYNAQCYTGYSGYGGYNYGYTPNYNYTPSYGYKYYQQTVNYPVVIGVPLSDLGINTYFSLAPEKREARIVEQVAKELIQNMTKNGYGIMVPVAPQPVQPVDPNQGQGQPQQPVFQGQQPVDPNWQQQQQVQPQQPMQPVVDPNQGQQQVMPQQQVQPQQPVFQGQQQMMPQQPVMPQQQQMPYQGQQPVMPQQQVPVPPQPGQQWNPQSAPARVPGVVQSQMEMLTLAQAKCMQCHKPGEIKKDVKLFNTDGSLADNNLDTRLQILNAVLHKDGVSPMPPITHRPLTTEEKMVFVRYVQGKM